MTAAQQAGARRAARDGGIQLAEGITAFTFPPPPERFDAAAASDDELAAYGLPRRPAEPRRREGWESRMRGSRMITPVFQPLGEPAPAAAPGVWPSSAAASVSDHYSGAVIAPSAGAGIDDMAASFMVPNPFPQAGVGAAEWSACPWVGIGDDDETNLFKLGCDCRSRAAGDGGMAEVQVTPFWQWLPAGRFSIPNFPVAPGDLLNALLLTEGATQVTCLLDNRTRGAAITFRIAILAELRNRAPISGKLGAWMVERLPGTELARFGEVFFSDAGAVASGGRLDLKTADLVTMRARGRVADPELWPPNLVRVVRHSE